jgi:hypothetical protein
MRRLVPDQLEFTTAANEEGDLWNPSLNDGDVSVLPDHPGDLETNPWFNASCNSFSTGASESESFQDSFGVLPDVLDQLHPTVPLVQATSNALTEREVLDAVVEGKSSGKRRKADDLFHRGGRSKVIQTNKLKVWTDISMPFFFKLSLICRI